MSWSFGTVKDYSGMLNRISVSTFFVSIAAIALLRNEIPMLDAFLKSVLPLEGKVPLIDIEASLGTVLPALIFMVLARAARLHDLVSDVLRIRQRFDRQEILEPMALMSAGPLTPSQFDRISTDRSRLMNDVFYRYASSRGKPAIDPHLIEMALDRWSWYWMVVEACCVALPTGVALLFWGRPLASACVFLGVLLMCWLLSGLGRLCAKHAQDEVKAILSDDTRREEIHKVFDAL